MNRLFKVILALLIFMSVFSIGISAEDDEDYSEHFTVRASYDVSTTHEIGYLTFDFNNDWFRQSAASYNHQLARLSMGMAVSAFRPNLDPSASENPALHLQDFLTQGHFRHLRSDDYDKNPSLYTVSTVIGYKILRDDQGEFALIAVGVCGGGYKNEWLSNFSCGDEGIHLGFESAAQEVYDRLFGYIAANGLSGKRAKVWVAGFSRAAAISNIFAAKISDSTVFSTDTVYAYTFATPRTTKNPKPGAYPNIFNICGKMDPVPSVAFADWGYDRYGTTLYTPAQQTDSDYAVRAARAGAISRKTFSLDFWNNVEWDTKLRVVLNYLLRIAPTSKIYTERLQDKVIKMWSDRTLPNIISTLMDIAGDTELINEENKEEANSLLTYIAYGVLGYATNSGIDSRYRNQNSTLIGNLAHEHTPEVYLSWLFSSDDPYDIYTDKLRYLRVVISGDVDVAIICNDEYTGLVKCLKADGTFTDRFEYLGLSYSAKKNAPDIFMERTDGEHILLLPKDQDYDIIIRSNSEQTVELHGIMLTVGYTNGEFNKVHYGKMSAGQCEIIHSPMGTDLDGLQFDIVAGDTFSIEKISEGTASEMAIRLERANILNLGWQQIIFLAFLIPIAFFTVINILVTGAIGKHRVKRKRRNGEIPEDYRFDYKPAVFIYLSAALFVLQELIYWVMPQFMFYRSFLKLFIGIMSCYLAFSGYRRQPSAISRNITIALVICTVADIVINYSFITAIVIYAAAALLLIYTFYTYEKPERWQYISWALFSVVSISIINFSHGLNSITLTHVVIYSIILMALMCLCLTKPKKIRVATLFLILGNIIMFFNEVNGASLYSHVGGLAVYYIAIMTFAFSTRYRIHDPGAFRSHKKPAEQTQAVQAS